jgi:succinate dehydrogenase / fumarate reductase membrane anchor subunit
VSVTRATPQRARELGSAKTGTTHWWTQRVTAIALVPLTLWFVAGLIARAGHGHAAVITWLESPLAAILTVLLLIALFQHMALGLQVVIEDYVHSSRAKLLALLVMRFGCLTLAVVGILAVVRITVAHA